MKVLPTRLVIGEHITKNRRAFFPLWGGMPHCLTKVIYTFTSQKGSRLTTKTMQILNNIIYRKTLKRKWAAFPPSNDADRKWKINCTLRYDFTAHEDDANIIQHYLSENSEHNFGKHFPLQMMQTGYEKLIAL